MANRIVARVAAGIYRSSDKYFLVYALIPFLCFILILFFGETILYDGAGLKEDLSLPVGAFIALIACVVIFTVRNQRLCASEFAGWWSAVCFSFIAFMELCFEYFRFNFYPPDYQVKILGGLARVHGSEHLERSASGALGAGVALILVSLCSIVMFWLRRKTVRLIELPVYAFGGWVVYIFMQMTTIDIFFR